MARTTEAPKPIASQIREAVGKYGWCRANGHAWAPPSNGHGALAVERGTVHVTFTCRNGCGIERTDYVSLSDGSLVRRAYDRPADYDLRVVGTGEERPNKSAWRRAHYRNLLGRTR